MDKLADIRRRKLMSLVDLAHAADLSHSTLWELEKHPEKHTPSMRTIRKICQALGVSPGDVEEFAHVMA